MKQKKRKTFQVRKKKNYDDLVKLVKTLDKKEEYKYDHRDDLDYYGIRDIENLFDNNNDNDDNYYKPVLVKTSFKDDYKYYENRGDKDKKLSVKQYLYKILKKKKMQKELLLRKDTYLQKKGNKLLMN